MRNEIHLDGSFLLPFLGSVHVSHSRVEQEHPRGPLSFSAVGLKITATLTSSERSRQCFEAGKEWCRAP